MSFYKGDRVRLLRNSTDQAIKAGEEGEVVDVDEEKDSYNVEFYNNTQYSWVVIENIPCEQLAEADSIL